MLGASGAATQLWHDLGVIRRYSRRKRPGGRLGRRSNGADPAPEQADPASTDAATLPDVQRERDDYYDRLLRKTAEFDDKEAWGTVPSQDFSNLPKVQAGMHSWGCRGLRLSRRQEMNLLNMQRELDRYVHRS